MSWWDQPIAESISVARIDADHFKPEYRETERLIRETGRVEALGDLVSSCRRGVQPEYVPDGNVLVINSQHVGGYLINTDGAERTTDEFWSSKPNAQAKKFDVLMNATGVGTIGRVNCVLHDEPTVVDNHVTIIRANPSLINPLYLAVFLNSPLGRNQTYKWQSGSSGQLEIYPDDIKRFLVVVPDSDVQAEIAAQLEVAFKAVNEATRAAAFAVAKVRSLVG